MRPGSQKALDPGLIYDLTTEDYLGFLCGLGYYPDEIALVARRNFTCSSSKIIASNLNYPSFVALFNTAIEGRHGRVSAGQADQSQTIRLTRTVTNVGSAASSYKVTVSPLGTVKAVVEPDVLSCDFTAKELLNILQARQSLNKLAGAAWLSGSYKWVAEAGWAPTAPSVWCLLAVGMAEEGVPVPGCKVGGFIVSIPLVMVAALLCVMSMLTALGLSNLRYSESSRDTGEEMTLEANRGNKQENSAKSIQSRKTKKITKSTSIMGSQKEKQVKEAEGTLGQPLRRVEDNKLLRNLFSRTNGEEVSWSFHQKKEGNYQTHKDKIL
ncbi:Subtilisin-like protease SBT1-7 [Nymphaea thermarum]|nr:Subtilisin-like protease SBT1-7 [Nymphaea thermarum]